MSIGLSEHPAEIVCPPCVGGGSARRIQASTESPSGEGPHLSS